MSKEYIFKYDGSKQSFLAILDSFHKYSSELYCIDNYMIEVLGDEIRFGVERAGHSGGNWFISKFTEENDQIEFRGTIQYIGPNNSCTRTEKIFDKIWEILLYILMFPIAIVLFLIYPILWLIRKIRKEPELKTAEDKLLDLMENRLNCQRVMNEKK